MAVFSLRNPTKSDKLEASKKKSESNLDSTQDPSVSQEDGDSAVITVPEPLLPCDADWPYVWAIRDGTYLDWARYIRHTDYELQAEIMCRQMALPVEIIPGKLYLADSTGTNKFDRLMAMGITGVVNMAASNKAFKKTESGLKKCGIAYRSIVAEDMCDYPLLQNHMEDAFTAIDAMTQDGGRCVVNCVMGKNRSVLIVAAYYMLHTKTPVLETMKHIRRQRGNQALVNEGFQEQLVALARRNNLLGARPGNGESIVPERAPFRQQEWWTTVESLKKKPPKVANAENTMKSLWKRSQLFASS